MKSILVIDDEPGIRNTVKDILEDEKYTVFLAEDAIIGLEILKKETIDLVILDVWLPRMGGIEMLKEIRANWPVLETIVISGHATIDMAITAIKLGAFDFIEKPLSIEKILTAVRNAFQVKELRHENARLKHELLEQDQLLGSSRAMCEIKKLIKQAAESNARVLITGENGTGKELVARHIHMQSDRKNGPFIAVNCAAIPENLIESELFGHEKGAFTDAIARRKGKFEIANNGTIFLDEIGDMSLQAQAKVLRVIQDMRFERVGGEQSIETDVRIIAATNKNLQEEIVQGNFREDLFYRLNVIPIHLPPLREREDDIAELAIHFLSKFCNGKKVLTPDAIQYLKNYSWPGNIRELRNAMERIAVLSSKNELDKSSIEPLLFFNDHAATIQNQTTNIDDLFELSINDAKEKFERLYLLYNLRKTGYNITKTAETIGIYPSNLHAKIKKFRIEAGE
ncbi:MAG TPA: sigma-54 dependent transcriptional regulator [Spirochaetia bacterium]|nr:sigma-54 dependent transcriptional regulator [Spirochaetales bacterium]HOT58403.1 sigma-54 dependent transcriptional regulator [Spirochaetales bacterium]HQG39990.1 sigma-54 dependent transcriptional regulator [Spirochaetales bacterium]HQK34527.1 sigma-54 dependent transcriptional regulator [Spirochaetales bacterium]HRS65733.1 sigma-54 dependent transcriptional regulator [Spirochaetia bacterium]